MGKHSLGHDSSGQVLIVTALLVAMLLLSTAYFVIEIEKSTPITQLRKNDFSAYKQSIRNTLISALANVTNGGDTGILSANLAELEIMITQNSYKSMLITNYTTFDTTPYEDGLWVSWGTSGHGISSAYVTFFFNSSNPSATSSIEHAVNVTSEVNFSGVYTRLTGNSKLVNLTVNMMNEAKPAFAQNFTFYFDYDGLLSTVDWIEVISPTIANFGNGTYSVSFIVDTAQRNNSVFVSMLCQDQRGILVSANLTCVRNE